MKGNTQSKPKDEADLRLLRCNSYERPYVLWCEMIREQSSAKRVSLFLDNFNMCDAPWPYRSYLAAELRHALKEVDLRDVLPAHGREWLASLEPVVAIYRGCERGRERGLSWTTNVRVATGLAIGKRCLNQKPTLMTAVIPKEHIFGVSLDRKEDEIIVDPRRLRRLRQHPDADQLLKAEQERRHIDGRAEAHLRPKISARADNAPDGSGNQKEHCDER
jgi:hypothetical protein